MFIATLPSYVNDCEKPSRKCNHSPHLRLRDRSNTITGSANAISLETGDWALAKAWWLWGQRKVKDWWEEELYEVEHQVAEGVPLYLMKNQWMGCSWSLNWNWLFLIPPAEGTPFCMIKQAKWPQCTLTTLEKQMLERSETEEVPWSVTCLLQAQQQTLETPLGLVNRKLCAILWTFSGTFLLDQG